jgi:hypothetical protein
MSFPGELKEFSLTYAAGQGKGSCTQAPDHGSACEAHAHNPDAQDHESKGFSIESFTREEIRGVDGRRLE